MPVSREGATERSTPWFVRLSVGDMGMGDAFGLVGNTLENKYEVRALVAEGGFGVVYQGVHRTLHDAVAIKVLKIPFGLDATQREAFVRLFEHEARTLAQLKHPAIVRVLDFGTSTMPAGGLAPWMVLEWIPGISLAEDLKTRRAQGVGGRSPMEVLTILRPALDALAFAHEHGIAHRDIKPANLMLVRLDTKSLRVSSQRGNAPTRLLDFGIAKEMPEDEANPSLTQHTKAQMVAYSRPYAAPEQVESKRTGPWTDVHAMGLIITELLTGQEPYSRREAGSLLHQAGASERPSPTRFGVDVGVWESVILRAVALDPNHRFRNAGELLTALESTLSDAQARSIPPTVVVSGPPFMPPPQPPEPTPPVYFPPGGGSTAPPVVTIGRPWSPPPWPTPPPYTPARPSQLSPWILVALVFGGVVTLGMGAACLWPSPPSPEDAGASIPPCPQGDGLYCGDGASRSANNLYQCTAGSYTLIMPCASGCTLGVSGVGAHCAAPRPPPCPRGDGLYCGDGTGRSANNLYRCTEGSYALAERCGLGCEAGSSGNDARCATPPPPALPMLACPQGDGLYCGDRDGQDTRSLYRCEQGIYTLDRRCSDGCETGRNGADARCLVHRRICRNVYGDIVPCR